MRVAKNGMGLLDLPQDPHDPANVPNLSEGRLQSREVDGLVVQDVGVKPLDAALVPEEDAGPRWPVGHGRYLSICMRGARVRIAIGPAVKVAVIRVVVRTKIARCIAGHGDPLAPKPAAAIGTQLGRKVDAT